MDPYRLLLVFSFVVWGLGLLGLVAHVVDVLRRKRAGRIKMEAYSQMRPAEWVFSFALLLSACAAAMGAAGYLLSRQMDDQASRTELLGAAAALAVGLAYVGIRGKMWFVWSRENFIRQAGATTPEYGQVWVNVGLESASDVDAIKRMSWPIYAIASVPLVFAAFRNLDEAPQMAIGGLALVGLGLGVVLVLMCSFPRAEEDEDW